MAELARCKADSLEMQQAQSLELIPTGRHNIILAPTQQAGMEVPASNLARPAAAPVQIQRQPVRSMALRLAYFLRQSEEMAALFKATFTQRDLAAMPSQIPLPRIAELAVARILSLQHTAVWVAHPYHSFRAATEATPMHRPARQRPIAPLELLKRPAGQAPRALAAAAQPQPQPQRPLLA